MPGPQAARIPTCIASATASGVRPSITISKTAPTPIPAGTVMTMQPGGGGGFWDPLDRDPERVREDVLNEYVSIEGAARDYGVVINPGNLDMDHEATRRLRAERRTC